jgi:acyl dehydratase
LLHGTGYGYRAPVNQEAEGLTYPDRTFVVDPARASLFGAVVGAGAGIPPTFVAAAEFAVVPTIVADPRLGLDFSKVVHGSQEYEYRRPVRMGEELTVRARIDAIKIRGDNAFLTIVIELVDPSGKLVVECRSTMIERGSL